MNQLNFISQERMPLNGCIVADCCCRKKKCCKKYKRGKRCKDCPKE